MNEKEFEKLLLLHKDRIFSYAFYLLRNRHDAEDVTQEVFLRYWNNRNNVEKKTRLAWMMRVTHNRCMDLLRTKRAQVTKERYELNIDSLREHLASEQDDPAVSYEIIEMRKMLLEAMDSLSEKTRSFMLLYFYEGLRYREIGEIMGESESTVKVSVHRGKAQLKVALRKLYPEKAERYKNEITM